jgi:hypothetical protein
VFSTLGMRHFFQTYRGLRLYFWGLLSPLDAKYFASICIRVFKT